MMAALIVALVATPHAHAKDKAIPLSQADAAALQGKTAAVVLHEPESFIAMTAGKAGFGLLGVGAMIKAGNTFVEENGIENPTTLVREQLSALLQSEYGLQVQPVDTTATKEKKAAKLAKLHPEADYVLSVRHGGWNYGYYATQWAEYWVGYSVQVQLIDTRTGRQVSNLACNANTMQSPVRPSRDQLHADGAALTKNIVGHLGWLCVRLLGKEQFGIADERLPAIPAPYVDPLAALNGAAPAPAAGDSAAPATDATPAAAEGSAPAAAPATETAADDAPAAPQDTAAGTPADAPTDEPAAPAPPAADGTPR